MKKTYVFFYIMILLAGITNYPLSAQSSQNGYRMTSHGTIRAFLIYAEAINDPWYDSINSSTWPKNSMPTDPDYLLDYYLNPFNIHGKITKYFFQASLGKLLILGDYLDTLVKIDWNTFNMNNKMQDITDYLNDSIEGIDIPTAHNHTFNGHDFDNWVLNGIPRDVKDTGMDGRIDLVISLWRVNSKFADEDDSGNPITISGPVKLKDGGEYGSLTTNYTGRAWSSIKHEISHSLIGSDGFTTAGDFGGERTTIPKQGGYSMLNYAPYVLGTSFNGFDRWRLGWRLYGKHYDISALNASTRQEDSTKLDYVPGAPYRDFILRDFVTTGDAIRIKLPYYQDTTLGIRNQYLWIENHQMLEGNLDLRKTDARGIYAYIQVGYDDLSTNGGGSSHYLTFLEGLGNYDMTYNGTTITVNSDKMNPFTGYSIIQGLAYNLIDPNGSYYDKIYFDEVFYPTAVIKDGVTLPASDFAVGTTPSKGSIYDPITPGRKISIGTNPSTVPVLTYYTPHIPNDDPMTYDNRKIYLNGLSFSVLECVNNEIKVRIHFSDFIVDHDTRWCGPIVLNEKVSLCNATITLDQGLTPTRPVNPIMFNGEKIFADPTIFTANAGSEFVAMGTGNAILKNNSAYVNELDGNLTIKDQSVFRVKTGSTLLVKAGSNLKVMGSGKVEIETGGCLCIENGANVTLQDATSQIHTQIDITPGVNTAVLTGNYDCRYNLASTPFSGSGAMNCDMNSLDAYYQNQTLTGTRTYSARNIYAGEKVRTDRATGLAKIASGANITLDASGDILFDNGFEAALGSTFEAR
jgi:hypothetical protein